MSDQHKQLAVDPMSTIRHGTHGLLISACARTGTSDINRIPMLVNYITFSWGSPTSTLCNICTAEHLSYALNHSITHNSTKLTIQCNTNLSFFALDFTGLDLD
jgi:hypothetical protein